MEHQHKHIVENGGASAGVVEIAKAPTFVKHYFGFEPRAFLTENFGTFDGVFCIWHDIAPRVVNRKNVCEVFAGVNLRK